MEDERKRYAEERMADYEDIIHCSRPASYKRNPMQRSHRAKQFAAFDALKGYEEAVRAQECLYESYRNSSSFFLKTQLSTLLATMRLKM